MGIMQNRMMRINSFLEKAVEHTDAKNKLSFVWIGISLLLALPALCFMFYTTENPALTNWGLAVDLVMLADLLAWQKYNGSFPKWKKPCKYSIFLGAETGREGCVREGTGSVDEILEKDRDNSHKEETEGKD